MKLWPLPGPDKERLDIDDVSKWCGHSPKVIRKKIKEEGFPLPRLRCDGTDYWHAADLAAWMQLQGRTLDVENVAENPGEAKS